MTLKKVKPKKFVLTTPLYYANDLPHVGSAYTTMIADVISRHKKLKGQEALLITGTDEHGQKVEKAAQAAEISPQSFTDQVSQNFRDLTDTMNFSNDDFIYKCF